MDDPTAKRNTWPHESPPARAELDAEKAWAMRVELAERRMRKDPYTMAGIHCQLEDDLAVLRLELRRLKDAETARVCADGRRILEDVI